MAQSAAMNFANNLVESFMQYKALQFQKDLMLRREQRYDEQLQENRAYRNQQLTLQQQAQERLDRQLEETKTYHQGMLSARQQQLSQPDYQITDAGEQKVLFDKSTGKITPTGFPSSKGMSVNIDMGKPAPATALKEITDYQSLGTELEKVRGVMETTKNLQGPFRGFLTETQSKWGKTPIVGNILGGLPQEGVLEFQKIRANIEDILGRLRSGGAITDVELELYGNLMPREDLPYETNVRNYNTFKSFLDSKIGSLQGAYKELGYRTPSGSTPVVPTPSLSTSPLDDLSNLSDAELEAIAGGR